TYPNIFMTKLRIEKGAFENDFPFNALTSDNFLEFTQKTPLNCFNIKGFIKRSLLQNHTVTRKYVTLV
ncbi:5171_t:CDS:2, partial [Dentiscutata erythropus]